MKLRVLLHDHQRHYNGKEIGEDEIFKNHDNRYSTELFDRSKQQVLFVEKKTGANVKELEKDHLEPIFCCGNDLVYVVLFIHPNGVESLRKLLDTYPRLWCVAMSEREPYIPGKKINISHNNLFKIATKPSTLAQDQFIAKVINELRGLMPTDSQEMFEEQIRERLSQLNNRPDDIANIKAVQENRRRWAAYMMLRHLSKEDAVKAMGSIPWMKEIVSQASSGADMSDPERDLANIRSELKRELGIS